jgi:hypothetical protein
MSATFKVEFHDRIGTKESYDVELARDGTMTLLGVDPAYEEMLEAMGGQSSSALRLVKEFQKDPIFTISRFFLIEPDVNTLIEADWVEHVLPIYEKERFDMKRPREVVQIVRDYVASGSGSDKIALVKAKKAALLASRTVANVARAAMDLANNAGTIYGLGTVSNRAASAVKNKKNEKAWQLRRLVHVVECLQAGKKWPRIGETL